MFSAHRKGHISLVVVSRTVIWLYRNLQFCPSRVLEDYLELATIYRFVHKEAKSKSATFWPYPVIDIRNTPQGRLLWLIRSDKRLHLMDCCVHESKEFRRIILDSRHSMRLDGKNSNVNYIIPYVQYTSRMEGRTWHPPMMYIRMIAYSSSRKHEASIQEAR